jgi:HSP20 family protein
MKTHLLQRRQPDWFTLADNPFALMRRFASTMDRWFDEPASIPRAEAAWLPSVDAFERDGAFVLRADLPGMNKDNVKVEVKDNMITIDGERKSDFEEEKDGIYRMERAYGSFYRAVPLPEGVRPDDVKATFKEGVLEVTAPLPAAVTTPKARVIAVEEPAATKAKPAA